MPGAGALRCSRCGTRTVRFGTVRSPERSAMGEKFYLTVYLSRSLAERAEEEARRRGWSVSRLLREALEAYLSSGAPPGGGQDPKKDGEGNDLLDLAAMAE